MQLPSARATVRAAEQRVERRVSVSKLPLSSLMPRTSTHPAPGDGRQVPLLDDEVIGSLNGAQVQEFGASRLQGFPLTRLQQNTIVGTALANTVFEFVI